ncbi:MULTISPECIES: cytochrome P450 [Streptomyces]|uniref:cytochrome P450 n=1 Tax=Streptomyces TaxID=1883 RepID=UPI001318CF34|nr:MULTISPECIES: cytochrome P450 [Streptomyces]QGZ52167.1 cytochrome P450 [Streptomyces sp. QHH-9511]GGT73880.1 cytochrome P450 [Streptomyces lateritius]
MAGLEVSGSAVQAPVAPGRIPLLGHVPRLMREPIAFLESLRDHGEVVRLDIGTWPVLVLTRPEHVHTVLVEQAQKFGRGRIFDRLRPMFGNGIVTTDGDFHRKQRRMIQPAFHRNHITEYTETMVRQAEAMSSSWTPGVEVSMVNETRRYALSSVAEMIFSGDLSRPAVAEVHRSLPIVLEGMLLRAVMPKSLDRLPLPLNRRFDSAAARLRSIIDEVIAQYRSAEEDRPDLLSLLLAGVDADTGAPMSPEQVRDEVIAIMFAGTETPATTLAWIFHELGRHPEAEKRLHAEVDAVVGTRSVRPEDLSRLTYTNHVFQEALRLHSPLLFTRRALAPLTLGGVSIPEGAELAYSPYALHRDPALFRNPTVFDPDRWAEEAAERPRPHSFVPFGAGQHKCIGDQFAVAEIVTALATVASRWHLRPAPEVTVREVPAGIPQPSELPMIPVARH